MKRIFSAMLTLVMILAALPAMASSAGDFSGTWVYSNPTEDGWIIEIFLIRSDGTVYYLNQSFRGGEVELGRQFVGEWSFWRNDASITYGNNASGWFRLSDDKTTLTSKEIPGLVFVRVGE